LVVCGRRRFFNDIADQAKLEVLEWYDWDRRISINFVALVLRAGFILRSQQPYDPRSCMDEQDRAILQQTLVGLYAQAG
jgi:hypothetical protein